jgi:predicted nucleic acid-binding protein
MKKDYNSVVLDTSFICSFYNKNDVLFSDAQALYENKVYGKEVIIPITVFLELVIFSSARKDFKNFKKFLSQFNYSVYYLDIFFENELNEYQTKKFAKNLKSIDLSILIAANSTQSELISFDKQLMSIWKKYTFTAG